MNIRGGENPIPSALVTRLQSAERVCVLTGAGTSAESGVPTFRDAQTGLWSCYRPEDLATPEAFARNPQRVWQWYAWRRKLVADAQPNAGHRALVVLENNVPDFTLVTQNVDGLHQRAGSQRVLELHGNIVRNRCSAEDGVIENVADSERDAPPACPRCGAAIRPDVIWFGEALPADILETAQQAAAECDVIFSIGTSALVQPAASLPLVASRSGALFIEINPAATPLTDLADFSIRGASGDVLPELVHLAWPAH